MPIKKPYSESPGPSEASSKKGRMYYNSYHEEMNPALRWPNRTVSIDVHRTDPRTQKIESLAHKYDIGYGNDLPENSIRQTIDPGMLHALHDSGLNVKPADMVALLAQEGRTDFGANDLDQRFFAHNNQAMGIYNKLRKMGYDEAQAGLPALIMEKMRVADLHDVPWQAAWNGMGTTSGGRTNKDYTSELNLNRGNIGINKPAVAVFANEMREPVHPRELDDINFDEYLDRREMVQRERDKMKSAGASDQETQRAFPDAPVPFPDDQNAAIYDSSQRYAEGGSVQYDPSKVQSIVDWLHGEMVPEAEKAYQAKRSQYVDDMTEHPSDLEKAVQDQFGMQPNMDRGALLPYKSKDKGWVAPEVAYQLAKLIASPSVAMHGGNISPQEAIEAGNTLSGFMTPAGLLSKPSPAMARMNVYHGSPHTFDAFDASKIGTGEGAQAYGHGVYFAESPKVASSYKESLSGVSKKVLGASFSKDPELWAAGQVYSKIPDKDIIEGLSILGYKGDPKSLVNSAKGRLNNELSSAGNLYKVDLPDEHIAKMLDWDKPLSEQSAYVQKVIENLRNDANVSFHEYKGTEPFTGERLYRTLGKIEQQTPEAGGRAFIKTNPVTISELLRQRGIPGIKYLDEQSRAKGAGTSNFVVFPGEEHNLKILKAEGGAVSFKPLPLYGMTQEQNKGPTAQSWLDAGESFNHPLTYNGANYYMPATAGFSWQAVNKTGLSGISELTPLSDTEMATLNSPLLQTGLYPEGKDALKRAEQFYAQDPTDMSSLLMMRNALDRYNLYQNEPTVESNDNYGYDTDTGQNNVWGDSLSGMDTNADYNVYNPGQFAAAMQDQRQQSDFYNQNGGWLKQGGMGGNDLGNVDLTKEEPVTVDSSVFLPPEDRKTDRYITDEMGDAYAGLNPAQRAAAIQAGGAADQRWQANQAKPIGEQTLRDVALLAGGYAAPLISPLAAPLFQLTAQSKGWNNAGYSMLNQNGGSLSKFGHNTNNFMRNMIPGYSLGDDAVTALWQKYHPVKP